MRSDEHGIEYRVVETTDGIPYSHGYWGFDAEAASASLAHMRDFYGKYGRTFVLQKRDVQPWENVT